MRILLIKGQSQYNALRAFVDAAAAAFQALGHEVVVLNVLVAEIADNFERILSGLGRFDFAFSYIILGEWRSSTGRSIGQMIAGPHIIQHVDHPFTHHDRLNRTARDAVILTIDRSHAEIVETVLGCDHFAFVGFNPHAAIGAPQDLPDDPEAYGQARPIRFLFTGSHYRPHERPWAAQAESIRAIFDEAAERALAQDWLAPHKAMSEALAARGFGSRDQASLTLMPHCSRVHEWVRVNRRRQFLQAAIKAGLPLTVYGSGYGDDLASAGNIDLHGPADFQEVVSHMARSRIVLNVNVNFGEGSHERPLCAMLAGAVCASEPSTFYDAHFETDVETGEMAYFRWSSLQADLERLRALAEDPGALHRMAKAGQAKVVRDHTWKSRAERIVEIARIARTANSWAGV